MGAQSSCGFIIQHEFIALSPARNFDPTQSKPWTGSSLLYCPEAYAEWGDKDRVE